MWLIRSKITERYKNVRGDFATIELFPDDSVILTIRDGDGKQLFQKEYDSRKGARIALGRFGKWEYIITVDTIKKGKTKGEVLRAVSQA